MSTPSHLALDYVQLVQSPNKQSLFLPIKMLSEKTTKPVAITALIDSGAQGNFISHKLVEKHNLHRKSLPKPIPLGNVDGTPNKHGDITEYVNTKVVIDERQCQIKAFVTDTGKRDMILGYPWLEKYNPDINWTTKIFSWKQNPTPQKFIDLLHSMQ